MGGFSLWHWLIVIILVLLLFGRGRISEMMGDVGKGLKSFKQGMADDDGTSTHTGDTQSQQQQQQPPRGLSQEHPIDLTPEPRHSSDPIQPRSAGDDAPRV
jgi:sec-independent protein translocase protein TatA